MEKIKRAIFIAAGEGNRLRPVTLETPKPLIKVQGKRMIDRSLAALEAQGVEEIYLVVGYKKERFAEIYGGDPRIHLIENPDYQKGNNITSLYWAREYLPGAMVLEADLIVEEPKILDPVIEKSGYLATWMEATDEWILELDRGRIIGYKAEAMCNGYRLWGISMWKEEDGRRLAADIAREYEAGNWNQYWDEVALGQCRETYDLGMREIKEGAVMEIDTLEELIAVDERYKRYLNLEKAEERG